MGAICSSCQGTKQSAPVAFAAMTNSEFAGQSFIQKSLANPRSPISVLSFWFGLDIQDSKSKEELQTGSYHKKMEKLWFFGGSEFDDLCKPFSEVVRDAGRKSLVSDENVDWDSVDGKLSQLILCDQFSRNCFRGSDEAFHFDETALELANHLADRFLSDDPDFYGSYSLFLVLAFMHSEQLDDHKTGQKVVKKAEITCPNIDWNQTKWFLKNHTDVIERFGRYPHRNRQYGRETTKEEHEWLASPDIPVWAKSQG